MTFKFRRTKYFTMKYFQFYYNIYYLISFNFFSLILCLNINNDIRMYACMCACMVLY